MNENVIPKWQRELKAFLGIKSGIILEGNVYDDFPIFQYENDEVSFFDADNLDWTILSLMDEEKTDVFFFDPVDGFYCIGHESSFDEQRKILNPLFNGYLPSEVVKENTTEGNPIGTVYLMPNGKKSDCRGNPENEKYIWVSEIIRKTMVQKKSY